MRFNASRLFSWGSLKDKVYADAPQSIQKSNEKIRAIIHEIELQMCGNIMENFIKRAPCLLGKPTSRANQGGDKKIPPLNDADSQVRPRRRTAGAGPDAISTGPPRCFAFDAH